MSDSDSKPGAGLPGSGQPGSGQPGSGLPGAGLPDANAPEERPFHDYAAETQVSPSGLLRGLLLLAGSVALVLGVIGIFVPVLPTTPFLLLTAACYARASVRFYNWLMNHRFLGSYIRAWRIERRIPKAAKIWAMITIVATIGTSVIFFIPVFAIKILVSLIGLTVIIYILNFPS